MKHTPGLRRLQPRNAFQRFEKSSLEQSIPARFERQVDRHPSRLAVKSGRDTLTYRQLDHFANQIARLLLDRSSDSQEPVAILVEQSTTLAAAVLGVLKAGKFYLPLDTTADDLRQHDTLEDAGARLVVADAANAALARRLCGEGSLLLDFEPDTSGIASDRPGISVEPGSYAYIYYTSGSTGKPKGVVDCHRNVLHNIMRYTNSLHVTPEDRFSLLQSLHFSGSVSSLFTPLLSGASVFPFDPRVEGAAQIANWILEERLTVYHSVPSLFRAVFERLERPPALRLVRLEGDQMSRADWEVFRVRCAEDCLLVNGLGATECGIVSQYFMDARSTLEGARVPIGYATDDMELLLLDDNREEVARGEVGEIAIRSPYLAHYWNRADLNEARFLSDPVQPHLRTYLTRDLGRARPDGAIEFLGRADFRLKVHGEWVDVAEVEGALAALPGVQAAAVTTFRDAYDDTRLVAYIVPLSEAQPTVTSLRRQLLGQLPDLSVPSRFVFLDQLPLDANGKIARSRFPAPGGERPRLEDSWVAASTAVEELVAGVWTEVLELEAVGVNDNFFDLGGDSLRLARAQTSLEERLQRAVPLVALLEHPTVRTLAEHLGAGRPAAREHGPARSPDRSQTRVEQERERNRGEAIAVIGMAGRFPGARHVTELWANLRAGRETVRRFSKEELEAGGISSASEPGYVPARGVVDDIDRFDASFFGLSVGEAALIDPQHRLWLECAWEAIEDAGCDPQRYPGSIGVFAGCRNSTYLISRICADSQARQSLVGFPAPEAAQIMIGNDKDFLPTRTSYALNLTGPSINVQSACSTSLVAVAAACQRLADREADVCLAGGVCVTVPSIQGHVFRPEGIASPDGHCRAFDADAEGTVFGDGVGVVVLKRLADALADGDTIDAVIRGWAVNNDGARKQSFAAPSVDGQSRVIQAAQELAGFQPDSISYVETHGTATPLGDLTEVEALTRAFRRSSDRRQFCGIGSLKTNVGHLDAAAGIAGLIKTVLCLKHGEIPPSLHFRRANPEIDFAASPFYVVDRLRAWQPSHGPRRAGVSAFGVGGTNCHVVLEEAPQVAERSPEIRERPLHLLTLSAKSEPALQELAARYRDFLSSSAAGLGDICYSANTGRSQFDFRLATVAKHAGEAADSLDLYLRQQRRFGLHAWHVSSGYGPKVAFLFGGTRVRGFGMAKSLYEHVPAMRSAIDRCALLLQHRFPGLLEAILGGTAGEESHESRRSALFALEYGLWHLWRSFGVRPSAMLGEGVGEHVAACAAGLIELEEALQRAAQSGRPDEETLRAGSQVAVISVDEEARPTAITRRFDAAMRALESQANIFVEVGPSATMIDVGQACSTGKGLAWLSLCHENRDLWEGVLDTVAQLYSRGVDIDWEGFDHTYERRRIRLPNYPFQRKRCWYESRVVPDDSGSQLQPDDDRHADDSAALLGRRLCLPFSNQTRFETTLSPSRPPILADHRLFGVHVVPASAHLSMLAAAAPVVIGNRPHHIEQVCFLTPLRLREGRQRKVQLLFDTAESGAAEFRLLSCDEEGAELDDASWSVHVVGNLQGGDGPELGEAFPSVDVDAVKSRLGSTITGRTFYSEVWALGSETGPSFRWINKIWHGHGEAVCSVLPPAAVSRRPDSLPPGLFEACFQLLYCCDSIETRQSVQETGMVTVPFRIARVSLFDRDDSRRPAWCYAKMRSNGRDGEEFAPGSIVGDLSLLDPSGNVVAKIESFELRRIHRDALRSPTTARPWEIWPDPSNTILRRLRTASGGMSVSTVKKYLTLLLHTILDVEPSELDGGVPLVRLGIDSLMALRLSHRVASELRIEVPLVQWLGGSSIDELAVAISKQLADES